jgi:ElaB/YqjD/DUF883 family membrane-anchored ribosome-binding protein
MASEITVTVGDLYENLHVQFSDNLDEEYEQAIRQNIENFLHNYNQQLDRRVEQQADVQTADEHVHESE